MYGLKIGSSEKSVLLHVRTVDIHSSENLIKQEKKFPYSEKLLALSSKYSGQEMLEVW